MSSVITPFEAGISECLPLSDERSIRRMLMVAATVDDDAAVTDEVRCWSRGGQFILGMGNTVLVITECKVTFQLSNGIGSCVYSLVVLRSSQSVCQ